MSAFPRVWEETSAEVLAHVDWLQFGYFLISMGSNGEWDWRNYCEKFGNSVGLEEFLHVAQLTVNVYNAAQNFIQPAFKEPDASTGDEAICSAMAVVQMCSPHSSVGNHFCDTSMPSK